MSDAAERDWRVLVTGGSGLVGRAVQRVVAQDPAALSQWYFASTARDGDLSVESVARSLFERVRPTHVVHLAAMVGGLYRNLRHNVEMYLINERINQNVLALAHEWNVRKCVSCLSTCIFPDQIAYPIDETMLHSGAPHESNLGYATAKRNLDVLNRLYSQQHGCHFTSIVPTNVFGPHDNYHVEDAHVIPALIHRCYVARERDEPFVVWGSGKPLRQFIFADDLARLLVWTLRHYDQPTPLILSVPEDDEVSIETVARMVARTMDYEHRLVFDMSKADGQFKKTASNAKLQRLYTEREGAAFPFTPLEQAVEATVRWFTEHYSDVRK